LTVTEETHSVVQSVLPLAAFGCGLLPECYDQCDDTTDTTDNGKACSNMRRRVSKPFELGNWEPRTPLHTVTDHILAIVGTPTTPIDNSEMVVNLEDYDLAATQPDDMDVENALIDSAYDSLRYEYGRSVADQWAKEKRLAIHQWLRRRNHQHANRQRKAGNR
jgi:hypothetical protein